MTKKRVMIAKLPGDHSTSTVYEQPKKIDRDSTIYVYTLTDFSTEHVEFQLDLYIQYTSLI